MIAAVKQLYRGRGRGIECRMLLVRRCGILGGEAGNLLVDHAVDVEIGIVVRRARLVPDQNVLQQRPHFRLVIRLERARIEEQEQDALFGAVDELAREIQILAFFGRREPLRDRGAVDRAGFRRRVRLHQRGGIAVARSFEEIPLVDEMLAEVRIIDEDAVIGLGAQPGHGPVVLPDNTRWGLAAESQATTNCCGQ